ncbi:nonsense-mediated mRNA decay factor SMG8 isoform X1 [Rhynchophorus ferrugineus]|uniref:nonsense-mediated mRNA decay factor SMG8 isoform X1 n=2 Tax=Rhynchophorus ferrugineus TaxID=354439 RepID=UPI003FCDDF09
MKTKNTFDIPNFSNLQDAAISSDKIVVVSVIGKSSLNTCGLKVKSIGRIFPFNNHRSSKITIKGYYDEENQTLYLYLYSLLDTDIFMEEIGSFSDVTNVKEDFLANYDGVKSLFCRYFLYLLYISHIVILSHPGSSFDTSYIQYFKALDILSKKYFDVICEQLESLNKLNTQWIGNGRPCTPRIIFYFERTSRNLSHISIKKLEHNLEDRIYHILKKTRIISPSGSSLFAIPPNDEYVYVADESLKDRLTEAVKGLIQDCQPGGAMQVEAPFSSQPYFEKDFMRFLQVHIQQAKTKGFDDIVSSGRHQHPPPYFELPILENWVAASKCLYDLLIKEEMSVSMLCTDTRFSDQRCLKVLPLAVARYQEGLPSHYAKAEHEARLGLAMALFRAQARGPKYPHYELQLEMDCQTHWENGRQQCEAASMTGNPCKLPKHSPDEEHKSGFIYKSVCDCGRKIGAREDPYTPMQANCIFYQQISKECQCSKLDRIEFPIFEPSIQEYKAATLNENEELATLSDRSVQLTPETEKAIVRQPSTTEYLPGMLTLNSPPSLLPVFSSWSLVCLGASSLYSHNLGLSESYHPGFLTSTNYLLPWDVTVGSKSKKAWPTIGKYSNRGRRGRPTNTIMPQTVKVFIGIEYECSSGHRFMLSAPDRMLKATPGSIVKDTGHKIAESDMPLYYPCSCRANKIAQLMRLHVVTPKAPVYCTLNPKIQPVPGAPIFISTTDGPTKLTQSAYWVMRLPFAYVADKEHFKPNLLNNGKLLQGTFGVVEAE